MQDSNGKRQRRASEFVFSRQPSENGPAALLSTDPQRRIKQLPVASSSPYLATQLSRGSIQDPVASTDTELYVSPAGTSETVSTHVPTHTNAIPMRRFHISRNAAEKSTQNQGLDVKSQQQRPIVFSERRHVKHVRQQYPDSPTAVPFQPGGPGHSSLPEKPEPDRPRKRPGQAARTPITPVTPITTTSTQYMAPPNRNVRLPSGAMMPWDVNSEKLAAEMQAYTLQEIGRSIAQSEANKPKTRAIASPSKFKPKKPALRYHERHPEEALSSTLELNSEEPEIQDVEMGDDDDADYVIDTYIRMPAYQMDSDTEDQFGLLVLDSQPDIDEFYKTQIEEEEEEEDFEEDENGSYWCPADALCLLTICS